MTLAILIGMDEPLTPLDEKALVAKTDREVAGDLFEDVRALIGGCVNSWAAFDADDQDSFVGEIFVKAVNSFEVGRAPFLAFLASYSRFYMMTRWRELKRKQQKFTKTCVDPDDPDAAFTPKFVSLDAADDEGFSLLGKTSDASAEAAGELDREELREALKQVITDYTDRPKVRRFLTRVAIDGDLCQRAGQDEGFGRSWGPDTLAKFMEFARTHSRMQAYREDA